MPYEPRRRASARPISPITRVEGQGIGAKRRYHPDTSGIRKRLLMHKHIEAVLRSLAVAALAFLAISVAGPASSAQVAADCNPTSFSVKDRPNLAAQVVSLINQHRAGKNLPQLSLSTPLTASSQWKSLHMAAHGYFDHNDPAPPVARTAFQRVKDCGYTGGAWGENIAVGYATAQAAVNGWLGSSGHRANIESAGYTTTGVGVAADASGRLYWTQSFGNDASGGAAPPPAPTQPAPPRSSSSPGSNASVKTEAQPAPSTTSGIGAKPAYVTRSTRRSRIAASVPFVHMTTGRPVTAGSVRCRAEVEGRRLRVTANVFRSNTARCAWSVPRWASGKLLTGVVAVQIGGTAATRLFIRELG